VAADAAGRETAAAPAGAAGHRSFLVHREFRYLKIAAALCAACFLAYALYDPAHGHSGNTWLGYTLGTIGALLIVWLAWFGVRKRQLAHGYGTAQAWASAHVYLGLALVVVATLHTGFQLGWNIHTLAYALMLLVVATGIYGVLVYAALPGQITINRRKMDPKAMLAEIKRLDESALRLAQNIDPETRLLVSQSVSRVQIGGSWWQQLTGVYAVPGELGALGALLRNKAAEVLTPDPRAPADGGDNRTLFMVADRMFDAGRKPKSEELQKLLNIIAQRKALVERLNRDITLRARMYIWLYLHVPLSIGLLAALLAHVISVFLYW
jgi:hypothetical protein